MEKAAIDTTASVRKLFNRPLLLLVHALCWGVVFVFYTLYFSRGKSTFSESLTFVGWLLPVTMATAYVLTQVLIPRFLAHRRYTRFVIFGIFVLVLSADLELLITVWLLIIIAISKGQPLSPVAFDVWGLLISQYLVIVAAVAVDLFVRWYKAQGANTQLAKARLEAELNLKEAELKLLKAQIQPHFLFNTLNSLYALTLERSADAPDMVLRLSGMLDYVLHRGDQPSVALVDEVEHLRDYLHLEGVRFGERVRITFPAAEIDQTSRIAPLLLIPLVENAFKHGVSRSSSGAKVDIDLRFEGPELVFVVMNSLPSGDNLPTSSGIGLKNLRHRLDLLYPDRHSLNISETSDRYEVVLRIDLLRGTTT